MRPVAAFEFSLVTSFCRALADAWLSTARVVGACTCARVGDGGAHFLFARAVVRFTAARLAQSVERKALNLVVVGSSPTVGVLQ